MLNNLLIPSLLIPSIIIAILLICALIFAKLLKTPKFRGVIGEARVKRIIGHTVVGEKYVINNLILETNGKTSQIDHVLINPKGVFVIETKNYSGDIYGSEDQREWTQVLAYGNVKNKIYNPLKQNATHVYNVKKIIGDLPVYSLVVFVQNNSSRINCKNVINLYNLHARINSGQDLINPMQMERAYNCLKVRNIEISTNEHVKNIEKQQKDLANGICPRCGSKLVLRNSKYGEFWGCSNYPKCKFIKNDNNKLSA
ncbi:MAG: NERD domain-containing protein [Clostridia bacterium]|nr:NERD domain-containing protein [Clostridia bacterium]